MNFKIKGWIKKKKKKKQGLTIHTTEVIDKSDKQIYIQKNGQTGK